MLRKYLLVFAMSGFVGAAQAQTEGPPLFDGRITLVALTGDSCATLTDQVGSVHRAVFRGKKEPYSDPAEAMSIQVRGGTLFVSAILDETFEGRRQIGIGSYIVDASRASLPDATFNLQFDTSPINATTPRFTFKGTWKHYRTSGCKATIEGVFRRRT
jgi:hypothetical protein